MGVEIFLGAKFPEWEVVGWGYTPPPSRPILNHRVTAELRSNLWGSMSYWQNIDIK